MNMEKKAYTIRIFVNVNLKIEHDFLINNYLDKTILVYNPIFDICFDGICSMTDKQSKPLYYSKDHLSDYANSEYLFHGFSSFIQEKGLL